MKVAICFIAAFLMLENLGALEFYSDNNSGQMQKSKYELSVSRFDFAKQDSLMPGLTLLINDSLLKESTIELTCAHTLSTSNVKETLSHLTPVETTLYARFSYRF